MDSVREGQRQIERGPDSGEDGQQCESDRRMAEDLIEGIRGAQEEVSGIQEGIRPSGLRRAHQAGHGAPKASNRIFPNDHPQERLREQIGRKQALEGRDAALLSRQPDHRDLSPGDVLWGQMEQGLQQDNV